MIMISLHKTEKSRQHLHAHKLLRECLRPMGIDYEPDKTPLTKTELGKPSLAEFPAVRFNLSHAEGIAACIVSNKECGIDCEAVREYRPNVMKRSFSESERRLVESASPAERDLLFFRLWTLKESYVKAIGRGISYPLERVEFGFTAEGITTNIEGHRFRQYIVGGGSHVISVCEKA